MQEPMRLLAATDFSVTGRHAGKIAIEWARRFDAELHWVHSAEAMPAGIKEGDAPLYANYVARARAYAAKQLDLCVEQSRETGLASEAHIADGEPRKAVLELARQLGVDGIIVGSHGHTGLKRAWVGSVAESIVRDARCPVLVVRGHDSPIGKATILVGDDLSPCSMPAREAAVEIAEKTGAPLEFIHSLDLGIPYVSGLEVLIPSEMFSRASAEAWERLKKRPVSLRDATISNRVVSERADTALCERAEEISAGLVVVGCHSREGLNRALLGSVAESVVRHSPCSVLVTRGHLRESH